MNRVRRRPDEVRSGLSSRGGSVAHPDVRGGHLVPDPAALTIDCRVRAILRAELPLALAEEVSDGLGGSAGIQPRQPGAAGSPHAPCDGAGRRHVLGCGADHSQGLGVASSRRRPRAAGWPARC